MGAVFSDFTSKGGTCSASASAYAVTNSNTGLTVSTGKYNTFSLTPNAGYKLTLTRLTFAISASSGAISSWAVRSSLDNYGTDIATGTCKTTLTNVTVNLPAASFTNIDAVTFRIYPVALLTNTDIFTLDNVSLQGTIPVIPAIPDPLTSNSPQCTNQGVTIQSSGSAPGGITWYWQTDTLGTLLTTSTSTYKVFTSGTYYLRAQNNSSLLWSYGSGP